MDARDTIEAYYDAVRAGEPLGPFFATPQEGDDPPVKFGISERLVGIEAIRDGLREQTETTTDWSVESRALRVTQREKFAWFSDDVAMAWTATDTDRRRTFDTRWSGTLERIDDEWRFVGMHVSVAADLRA